MAVASAMMFCAGVLVFAMAAPAAATDDAAKTSNREAVLGTFHIGPKRPDSRVREDVWSDDERPSDDALAPEFSKLESKDLLQIFASAHEALQNGDRVSAQRLYERVIAAQPNSRLADEARRELAALYGARDKGEDAKRDRQPQQIQSDRYAEGIYGPHRPNTHAQESARNQVSLPPRQRSRRVVMLERQFIADVGDRVFFAPGSAQLGARARDVLAQQAAWLEAYPDLTVTVEGHADDGAIREDAQDQLSFARAEAVRKVLVQSGISASRVSTQSLGQRQPIARCKAAECAAQNRRVVTVISDGPVRTAQDMDDSMGVGLRESDQAQDDGIQLDRAGRRPARAFR